ncbi:MAG: apolipoprotein N-acyltransferase [Myxococcota bacterium]|nr:apolipoprotein N-acyltransferase [Myxococcota bacterium]
MSKELPPSDHAGAPAGRRPAWPLLGLALVCSGAGQALISPPLNWWWLLPVLWLPGLWALSHARGPRALLFGWCLGTSALLAIFYWIVHTVQTFSNLPLPVAVVVLVGFSLFWGFYAAVFAWGLVAVRRACRGYWPLGVAAWFVACEYLNPQLFPFYQGVVLYQQPWIFLATALAGVPFLSFLVMLCNALLLQILERRRAGLPLRAVPVGVNSAVLVSLVLVAVLYSGFRLRVIDAAEEEAETARIAMVQTNRGVEALRVLRKKGPQAQVEDFARLSAQTLARDPDIDVLVWPEGALRGSARHPTSRSARRLVRDHGVELWTGGGAWKKAEGDRRVFFNSGFRLSRSTEEGSRRVETGPRYDKNILLPFGEFMPLEDLLPILKKIQGVGNYEPGEGLVDYETPHGHFVFLICYEAIRHRYVRGGIQAGADLLVNITYDAWFGDTSNPTQHLMLSAAQSAQYGVPLVRAATTGISAYVDARGVLVDTSPLFKRTVLVSEVKRVQVPSPYAALGDWFAWICVLSSALIVLWGKRSEPRWRRTDFLCWGVIATATLFIPKLAWLANPYILLGDWLAWGSAAALVLVVGLLQFRRRVGGGVES